MAILTFAHGYVFWGGETRGSLAGTPQIDTFEDTLLQAGDEITVSWGSQSVTYVFEYASGDGFVAHDKQYPGTTVWFTNTAYPNNTPVTNTGSTYAVACFLEGTLIATPGGEAPVESLAVGDLVMTAEGETRPIRWMGHKVIATRFADPRRVLPVRIAAGALGQGLPRRDLLVSPDHALLLDGMLVQAGALVGQPGIATARGLPERVTYFHIELADHALVLAEGAAAETFVDNATRRGFDNHAEFLALYGEAPESTGEMDLPRVKSARQLPARWRQAA